MTLSASTWYLIPGTWYYFKLVDFAVVSVAARQVLTVCLYFCLPREYSEAPTGTYITCGWVTQFDRRCRRGRRRLCVRLPPLSFIPGFDRTCAAFSSWSVLSLRFFFSFLGMYGGFHAFLFSPYAIYFPVGTCMYAFFSCMVKSEEKKLESSNILLYSY